MEYQLSSDDLIETLISLHYGDEASLREKYVLRESLRNLVRLAKSEVVGTLLRDPRVEETTCDENVYH